MENCPYCDAPGSYREATDGSCYVCGMMLPDLEVKNEPNIATAIHEPLEQMSEPAEPSNREEPTVVAEPRSAPTVFMEGSDPPAIDLIHPRNLSPEYARRVTAAWQATRSPFKNPLETINSSKLAAVEAANLLIRSRTVGKAGEVEQADYELKEVIGEGNMGTVWSARQASLDREIAIKVPKSSASGSSFGRQLFISEVVVTGQLDHPNIVPIYDLARDEAGQLFYAMKRVEGRSWDTCMHESGRTRHDNVEILMKVCDAVRFAHDRKVIHRDIKPQNIMVGKFGEVSVMDWGIALRLPEGTQIPGMAKISPSGTPAYMAPEMATGNANEIGYHTDVYLLGAVLYEIITGEPPHPAPSGTSDLYVQQKACLLIAARNVITPAKETGELVDIAYKAMATDISDRYPTVDEFQSAIRDYFAHSESIALTDRGETHLANARELRNGVYEDYGKARFAFDEAIELWPENARAHRGLSEATHDYARSALERGDYALGLSLLRDDNPAYTELGKKLRSAKRKHDRNRFMARASAAAAVLSLIAGVAVSLYFFEGERRTNRQLVIAQGDARDAKRRQEDAERATQVAEQNKKEAESGLVAAKEKVEKSARDLNDNQTKLRAAEDKVQGAEKDLRDFNVKLEAAKKERDEQVKLVNAAKAEVEQTGYRSEIEGIADDINHNAFTSARSALQKVKATDESRKVPLRNWEWGHLMYQAAEPSVSRFPIKDAPRIDSVAIAPNQKWFAAAADDKTVYIWFSGSDNPLALKQKGPVSAVAISRDSNTLITAAGNEISFWTLPAGEAAGQLVSAGASLRYSSPIRSVAPSPTDPDIILTSADDSTAQVWSRKSPEMPIRILAGHLSGPVWQARFSPSGQQIVTAGEDGSVRVWNAATGENRALDGHRGPVYAAEFSPDGKSIVSGGRDRRLLVWNAPAAADLRVNTKLIQDRLQTVQEPNEAAEVRQLGEHAAAIHCLAFSADDNVLFSGSDDNSLNVWDTSGGVANARLEKSLRGHGGWVHSCAAAAGGHVLSGAYDGQVFLWDWKKYAFPRVLRPESRTLVRFTSAATSSDAHWIATASEDGIVTMWDVSDPLLPKSQQLTEGHDWQATTGIYFQDGRRLLTAAGDNSALIWDAKSGNELVRIGGVDAANGTGWRGVGAASHDGKWVATGSNDPSIVAKLWDTQTGRLVASLAAPKATETGASEDAEAAAVAFAPDDKTVFVGDQSGRGYLFHTADGAFVKPVLGHTRKINAARFLPNGHLLTASSDSTVIEWNIESGNAAPQIARTFSHRARVAAMDVSRDGKLLVTAADSQDDEAVLRLWNIESGALVQRLTLTDLVGPSRSHANMLPQNKTGAEDLPAIRSVTFHSEQPQVLITLFDPTTSKYQLNYRLATWNWSSKQASVRWIATGLHDTSMAAYSPNHDGSILTVGGRGARVRLANNVVMNYRPQTHVQAVAFSPNSQLVASAGDDGSIKLWRLDRTVGRWAPDRKLLGHRGSVRSVAFHPKRDDLLLSAGEDGTVRLWRPAAEGWSTTVLNDQSHGSQIAQAIFTPTDEKGVADILVATDQSVNLFSIDGKQGKPLLVERPVHCLAVSPDRKWLVGGVGNEAWIWNRAALQGPPVQKLPGHSAEITAVAFSSDGQRLFTAGRDFHVKLWDATNWQAAGQGASPHELLTLEQHTDSVVSLCLFPSAKYPALLTAGADGQAILWPSVSWH
jgi:WD40 repeat protein/serine/threonine protein kinase